MSSRHITIKKISENDEVISYKILCPDFNDKFKEEDLGIVEIDKGKKDFVHVKDEIWMRNKLYPIKIFALDPQERAIEIKTKYSDFAGGAWGKSIFDFLQTCIRENTYPDNKMLVG